MALPVKILSSDLPCLLGKFVFPVLLRLSVLYQKTVLDPGLTEIQRGAPMEPQVFGDLLGGDVRFGLE